MKVFWLLAALGVLWLDVLWMVYTRQVTSISLIVFFLCQFVYGLLWNRLGRRPRKEQNRYEFRTTDPDWQRRARS